MQLARKDPDCYPNLFDPNAVEVYLNVDKAKDELTNSAKRKEYNRKLLKQHNRT